MQGTAVFALLHQAGGIVRTHQRVAVQFRRCGSLIQDLLIHIIGQGEHSQLVAEFHDVEGYVKAGLVGQHQVFDHPVHFRGKRLLGLGRKADDLESYDDSEDLFHRAGQFLGRAMSRSSK